jgi:predicted PolB exonuclease-like 3'-5' exonuclease
MAQGDKTAYLVIDSETVPDGKLLGLVKYKDENLNPDTAVLRAQKEAREQSWNGSDFLPATFQVPVAVCVLRVDDTFRLQKITALDAPQYRPREIVRTFWDGLSRHTAKLITFNGRSFDLPMLEVAAFRYGCAAPHYFLNSRGGRSYQHIDILAWLNNFGACRHAGGLNLFSKLLGKPGKMETAGDQVYQLHCEGRLQDINDYCMFDTLDTYFVFLRTRVLTGELTLEEEHNCVQHAKAFLIAKTDEFPGLRKYLSNWGDWEPWP